LHRNTSVPRTDEFGLGNGLPPGKVGLPDTNCETQTNLDFFQIVWPQVRSPRAYSLTFGVWNGAFLKLFAGKAPKQPRNHQFLTSYRQSKDDDFYRRLNQRLINWHQNRGLFWPFIRETPHFSLNSPKMANL
jgi:hypothetical protein